MAVLAFEFTLRRWDPRDDSRPLMIGEPVRIDVPKGSGAPPIPQQIHELWLQHGCGKGYGVCVQSIETEPKQFSPERKARMRLQRLRARMQRKYPLFAEEFIAAEIAARPKYFSAEAIAAGTDFGGAA